ncbi:hypothetical protein QJS10_CPA01g01681 [Acorus calamus]|uniref:CCHC-type domain-containing protein n=1 Tax=Acorus calamus TaxID=4465 RepID=A0AAV9FHW5_ACOCL|nr:hypothetical protein QJS10_CPA01g01681 [Acorus calamus]
MARWVEREANDGGWRVRTRRTRRVEEGRPMRRRYRGEAGRENGRDSHQLPVNRCFRCLGSGHWSRECREPLTCRRCGGTGHRAFQCTELKRRPGMPKAPSTEETLDIQLGDSFNPCDEARTLRCCVVASTDGWTLFQEELENLLRAAWGSSYRSVERELGSAFLLVRVMNPKLRARMVRRGVLQGSGGPIRLVCWMPEFGTSASESSRWKMRLVGCLSTGNRFLVSSKSCMDLERSQRLEGKASTVGGKRSPNSHF